MKRFIIVALLMLMAVPMAEAKRRETPEEIERKTRHYSGWEWGAAGRVSLVFYEEAHMRILGQPAVRAYKSQAKMGELPRGVPNNLVPYITQTAAGIRECLSIFGDDYDTPDGSCLRDYIDIVDLARAHVVAIDRMVAKLSEERYEVFNIGTGRPVSVFELVKGFEQANNLKLNYRVAARRAGDVTAVWADTTRANEVLGWRAERELSDTLKAAWQWERNVRGIEE